MRITKIRIRNFRGYQQETTIDIHNFTAIIGKNDIGKSTILEALDIFFNDGKGIIKLDKDDINIASQTDKDISISVCFDQFPSTIVIDDTQETTLESEYLLNTQHELEISKIFKNGSATASNLKIFIVANHPSHKDCSCLLTKKQNDLTGYIDKFGIQCDNKRINHIMRKAIWQHFASQGDLQLRLIPIEVNSKEGDIKNIWSKIQNCLPHYALFQSDRKNSDNDSEVHDPLKEAVKIILKEAELQEKLSFVAEKVRQRLQEVSDLTLSKLNEMNPEIASSLHPRVPESNDLKWNDVFKSLSICGDNDIPINKRGSGVKRLILLNFFRAEAERRQKSDEKISIVYAIEEPETSQHKKHQEVLLDSLLNLSKNNCVQIIITTHSASIVKRLEFSNLVLIQENDGIKEAKPVHEHLLPYPSINEVNFLAFQEISVEYHNELYGYLQSLATDEDSKNSKEKEFDNWLKDHGCIKTKNWIRLKDNIPQQPYSVTVCTYIRNCIHHPENTSNIVYTSLEIEESIKLMRDILVNIH